MRYLRIVGFGALGLVALCGFFVAICVVPKVSAYVIEQHTQLPDWVSAVTNLNWGYLLWIFYCLSALMALSFILALVPFRSTSIQRLFSGALAVLAWGTSVATIYFLAVGSAGLVMTSENQRQHVYVYASILDQFSLRQTADGKFDQVQALLAHFKSAKLMEVTDPNTLSLDQRGEQINGLMCGLKSSTDVPFLKQVLATTNLFRNTIEKVPDETRLVLQAAALCGAPSDNINSFYVWLEPKLGTDGWNQVPLHVMVFDQ